MKAYKLTFETTDFEGLKSTFKTTAYNDEQIKSAKQYHEDRGAKLINVKDVSVN